MSTLDAELATTVAQWPVGTASVAVVGPDGVIACHDDQQRHRWASVTKVVSALAVLDACIDGLLTLDQPAGPPGSTVRHLLAHASGLAPDSDDVLAAPATRRIYSNRGIEVAVEAVSDATGQTAGQLLSSRVTEPLAMTGCTLDGSPAHGMSGGIMDLAALAVELLNSTTMLPGVVAGAHQLTFPGLAGVLPGFGRQQHNDWGLGCEIKADKRPHWTSEQNSPSTFGHFGQSGSFLWIDPVAGIGCVSLCDTRFGEWATTAWPELSKLVLSRAA